MEYKVYKPGEIIIDGSYYFDQLSSIPFNPDSYDGWVFKSNMRSYLESNYGLTPQQYYNIVVHGDINYVHKCECTGCETPTEFATLKLGYRQFCCRECQAYKMWEDPDRVEQQREVGRKSMEIINDKLWNSEEYEEFRKEHSIRMSEMMTENNCDQEFSKKAVCAGNGQFALNNFGPTCCFYIWTRDSYLKIGIAGELKNIKQKINTYCPDYLIAYEGPTQELADLEYKIKMNNQALPNSNEFFDIGRFDEFNSLLANKYKIILTRGT